ncbi:ABC transporter substrate-binding protein [Nakamurella endophytica]|uniref:Sugar ABC transporter substrate-binding protein n=1 Tax=Nakamurella endophytica TaxID=1748367 RepID=A0A917WCE0_9ACTN|nr:sugar ABC transporter substrate-binding protein [Nakamurella endophytica]GGL89518.1 sugar ABC transporter substrate-binding protein [Nakamurella endophytica]
MKRSSAVGWLAVGCTALTVLAACSQGSATAGSNSSSSSSSTESGSTAASSADASTADAGTTAGSTAGGSGSPSTAASSSAPSSSSSAPAGNTTITYMDFSASGGHEKDLQKIVDGFQKENPGITVKVQNVAYADYFTKLQTAVAGGTAADAFELDYQNFISYADNGALAELSGVDRSVYRTSLYDAFTMDGKQFGLPESFSDVVLFYNKTLFAKAGVPLPTSSWTWADEKAAAQKLTDKSAKVWGDYQPITYNEFYKALAQSGGQFFNADKSEATFSSQQGTEAADWLIGKSGTVMPTVAEGAGTPDFDTNLFKSGKLAMWHTGIWMFSAMADAPFDWDVVVEPGNTTKASAMFANTVAVSASSKNQAAAQKWLQYLTASDTAVSTRLAASWELPPIADDAKLATYLKAGKPANRKAVFDALEKTVLAPVITNQQEMQDDVNDALTAAAAGRTPVDKALSDAQSKVTALLGG